jgi:hypothetical protein
MHGDEKAISDLPNEILGRIIGLLGLVDGRSVNRVNRDWHSINMQPHEQKKRVEKYFPSRVLGVNDTDFESIFREESKKLLEKLFSIIKYGIAFESKQDNELLSALNKEQILPYVAAALAGEISHVKGLGKAENDFLHILAASHNYAVVTELDKLEREQEQERERILHKEKVAKLVASRDWALLVDLNSWECRRQYQKKREMERELEQKREWIFYIAAALGCAETVDIISHEEVDSEKTESARNSEFQRMFSARCSAVGMAGWYGHLNIVKLLYPRVDIPLFWGPRVSCFLFAAEKGHHSIVEFIYSQMTDMPLKYKLNALDLAVKHGHYNVVKYLYTQMIDVMSLKDKRKVIILAAKMGHHPIVEYLYPQIVDVMSPEDKVLVLGLSVQSGHKSVVEYLYPQVADVMPVVDKIRASVVAEKHGHYSVVEYLLTQYGDDFSIEHVETILNFAKCGSNAKIINYLEELIIKRAFLELTGVLNSQEWTPQFNHSRKDENNQAEPSAGWSKVPRRG